MLAPCAAGAFATAQSGVASAGCYSEAAKEERQILQVPLFKKNKSNPKYASVSISEMLANLCTKQSWACVSKSVRQPTRD